MIITIRLNQYIPGIADQLGVVVNVGTSRTNTHTHRDREIFGFNDHISDAGGIGYNIDVVGGVNVGCPIQLNVGIADTNIKSKRNGEHPFLHDAKPRNGRQEVADGGAAGQAGEKFTDGRIIQDAVQFLGEGVGIDIATRGSDIDRIAHDAGIGHGHI